MDTAGEAKVQGSQIGGSKIGERVLIVGLLGLTGLVAFVAVGETVVKIWQLLIAG